MPLRSPTCPTRIQPRSGGHTSILTLVLAYDTIHWHPSPLTETTDHSTSMLVSAQSRPSPMHAPALTYLSHAHSTPRGNHNSVFTLVLAVVTIRWHPSPRAAITDHSGANPLVPRACYAAVAAKPLSSSKFLLVSPPAGIHRPAPQQPTTTQVRLSLRNRTTDPCMPLRAPTCPARIQPRSGGHTSILTLVLAYDTIHWHQSPLTETTDHSTSMLVSAQSRPSPMHAPALTYLSRAHSTTEWRSHIYSYLSPCL
jgi:hypothetical protein